MTKSVEELAQRFLGRDARELGKRELRVLRTMAERQPVSIDLHTAERPDGFWDRLADHVAAVGGSWSFIFGFFIVLLAWVTVNGSALLGRGLVFDPYPFIFLNLMLSMLAAIQAPIIMMSQNRAADKDREAAAHDYEVNLRAELEIMRLHEKMDAMRAEQLATLIRHQSEMLELMRGGGGRGGGG
ncbi:MAG: DUF1003 domain-containing protein [Alphaproteobacteria bacterium]|nr:DUF1003 domain-containing protein [Alphaproteobacteria bacterium]